MSLIDEIEQLEKLVLALTSLCAELEEKLKKEKEYVAYLRHKLNFEYIPRYPSGPY